jgi:hypothetical protein
MQGPDSSGKKWIDRFAKIIDETPPREEVFWKRRKRLGLGVGLDEYGNLTCEKGRRKS